MASHDEPVPLDSRTGRPRAGQEIHADVTLSLRVPADARERWRSAADADGLTLSAWVRRALDSVAR